MPETFHLKHIRELAKSVREDLQLAQFGNANLIAPTYTMEFEMDFNVEAALLAYIVKIISSMAPIGKPPKQILELSIGFTFQIEKSHQTMEPKIPMFSDDLIRKVSDQVAQMTRGFVAASTAGYWLANYPMPAFDGYGIALKCLEKARLNLSDLP